MNKLSKITVLGVAWVMGLSVIGAKTVQAAEANNRGSDNAPLVVLFETIKTWDVLFLSLLMDSGDSISSLWQSGDTVEIPPPRNTKD